MDGMIPTILGMLEEDQSKRITASEAAEALERHYQSLQADSQLRRPIEVPDNPGGPPASDESAWDHSDHMPQVQGQYIGPLPLHNTSSFYLTRSRALSPSEYDEITPRAQEGSFHRPPPLRRMPATFDSTGATGQLDDLGLQDKKRSASEEMDSGNTKRPWNVPQYESPRH